MRYVIDKEEQFDEFFDDLTLHKMNGQFYNQMSASLYEQMVNRVGSLLWDQFVDQMKKRIMLKLRDK